MAIDSATVIKGSKQFTETGSGAYYYAFSPVSSAYSEAFSNIKLPTRFNNVPSTGNPRNYTRNGYIALGIHGSYGIDLGLKNDGTGWFPCGFDMKKKADLIAQGKDPSSSFFQFPAYKAPSTATNALIVVKPVTTTSEKMYVQFLNSSGANVGTMFDQEIQVASGNLTSSGGLISCRYYRFASLVPTGTDNQKDSTFMLGGQFTNLGLYNRNTKTYDAWGIGASLTKDAWKVSPERINLTYTNNSDSFNIDHYLPV